MNKRLFDVDPGSLTQEIYHYDPITKKSYIQRTQNVEPYLEKNKKLANCPEYQAAGKKQDFMHIATIPNEVIVEIKDKHGIDVWNKDDLPKLERLLQSREYMYLRTVDRI